MSTTTRKEAAKAALDLIIQETLRLAGRHLRTRAELERLLHLVRVRTDLLHARGSAGRVGRSEAVAQGQIVVGLLALASRREDWLRPAGDWRPAGDGALPRFASLAQHLLAHYPVPGFMASVWFLGRDA
jgi:hypothetical protein